MSFKFNPFTANFDEVGAAANTTWKDSVATVGDLPASGNTQGDVRVVRATWDAYVWTASAWTFLGPVKAGAFGSSPNTAGLSVGSDNTVTLQPADGTRPGGISTGAQTIPGAKTFAAAAVFSSSITASTLNSAGLVHTNGSGLFSTSALVNADVDVAAAIAYSKLNLTGSIVNADINTSAAIVYSKLSLSNSIVNADINASAAIAYSKLTLSGSIVNADINTSAAIVYSKLSLSNSIVNADINSSAAIAYSKLSLSGSIVNADINTSAAIAVSKLAALTASRAIVSDGSGFLAVATTTATEIGYVNGVTSAIQTQLDSKITKSAGDIAETNFSAANNQSGVNVTGLAFANATVRSFQALVSVYVNATSPLYEVFQLLGIQKGAGWDMSATSSGDASGFTFSITSAGQVQYTDSNYSGFTAATLKFRAETTSV